MRPDVPSEIPVWQGDRLVAMDKLEVHRRGLRHPAVSIFVLDGSRLLLQRRAATKYHTPGLWANTCCTHPHWGEDALTCAHRRLREELGITGLELRSSGEIEYRAEVGNGLIEHESVTLFVAHARAELVLAPDPAEVAETRWAERAELQSDLRAQPELYTPWLRIYLDRHPRLIFTPSPLASRQET